MIKDVDKLLKDSRGLNSSTIPPEKSADIHQVARLFKIKLSNRITFILSHIPFKDNSSHKDVLLSLMKSLLISSEEIEIQIIITGKYLDIHNFQQASFSYSNRIFIDSINNYLSPSEAIRVRIDLAIIDDPQSPLKSSYESTLRLIQSFMPEHVILSRDNLQTLYLDSILSESFNLIDLPFNKENGLSRFSKSIITHLDLNNTHSKKIYKFTPSIQLNELEKSYFLKETKDSILKNKSKINLISIIGADRTSRSLRNYTSEILDLFLLSIFKDKRVVWNIYGESSKDNFLGITNTLDSLIKSNRVVIKGTVDNVHEVLEDSDIYIQPPGVTGGGKVAGINAVIMKIPVVLFNHSDCQSLIGNPPYEPSIESGLIYFKKLMSDHEYKVATTSQNLATLNKILIPQKDPKLIVFLKDNSEL
ncbi:hypothetical protein QCD60_16845 [Pokkaliibacter sp. MBI-7]|uniref:hypothetical protein n=1 Tax=Pokkaliibacter sp. MBI-7 TaxID=3040600 RepID=UPI0024470B5F|nr:hypothetical protein [Pokkaliibacter sp. MBI-7]MDH2434227.1 hypothetical protein [Pokkaliibacter sp. MBI-7]